MSIKPAHRILIVEDNAHDVQLLREAFAQQEMNVVVHDAHDGETALEYLRNGAANDGLPQLILLDLGLPEMSGAQLLEHLKADPKLRRIPVVVLTGDATESVINRLYDLQANGYLIKPKDFNGLVDLVRLIEHYWFGAVRLPI